MADEPKVAKVKPEELKGWTKSELLAHPKAKAAYASLKAAKKLTLEKADIVKAICA